MKKQIMLLLLAAACVCPSWAQPISRDDYPDMIDLAKPVTGRSHQTQLFADQGSWMGFSYQTKEAQTMFTGPYSIQGRYWFARSLASIGEPGKVSYYPGVLKMKTKNVDERLLFADGSVALLGIDNRGEGPLTVGSVDVHEKIKMKIKGNRVFLYSPMKETVIVDFPKKSKLKRRGHGYVCTLPKNSRKNYLTISFVTPEQSTDSILDVARKVMEKTAACEESNKQRWDGYLKAVIRPNMEKNYNRVAAKSVMTLLSNWRNARGGLLHRGIVPSHAVGYFIGFWAWDSFRFSAAMASFYPELAKDNVRAIFDYQQPDGMIIDCIYVDPAENNYRDSKPPLASWAVDEIYKHTGDKGFLREMYPKLVHYYKWWYEKRDHDNNGICEFGSCDGTREAAGWESGMDNAVRFDHAKMLKNADDAWSLDQESVDLNGYLALEYTLLKKFAGILGEPFNLPDHRAKIANYFFDEEDGYFYDRRVGDGGFVKDMGCEGYLPFWVRIATPEQFAKARKHFEDSRKFATYIPFPTVAANHPSYTENGYWRGPIWLDQTYYGIEGYRNYGEPVMADTMTRLVFDRLKGLTKDSPIYENYDAHSGRGLQASNFSWSAAHLLMLYLEYGKNREMSTL